MCPHRALNGVVALAGAPDDVSRRHRGIFGAIASRRHSGRAYPRQYMQLKKVSCAPIKHLIFVCAGEAGRARPFCRGATSLKLMAWRPAVSATARRRDSM